MFISIQDLELRNLEFRQEFPPEAIDLGPDIGQSQPLRARGHAELVEEHRGKKGVLADIRLVGEVEAHLELKCARCLEPVTREVASKFDLLYRPLGSDAGVDEREVGVAEAEVGYYTGEGLLLEDVLREQVLLGLPLKAVCREDCKGLCPRCGRNLNLEPCACTAPAPDARWSALKDLKEKLGK